MDLVLKALHTVRRFISFGNILSFGLMDLRRFRTTEKKRSRNVIVFKRADNGGMSGWVIAGIVIAVVLVCVVVVFYIVWFGVKKKTAEDFWNLFRSSSKVSTEVDKETPQKVGDNDT
jgi:hypothetical protein